MLGFPSDDNRFVLWEEWESDEHLRAHQSSEYFGRLVPQLAEVADFVIEPVTPV